MRTGDIKSKTQFDVSVNKSYKIINYDQDNNYPEKIDEITKASGTAIKCLALRKKFLFGHGFPESISDTIINRKKQTLQRLLNEVIDDYNKFDGCGVHVNYNANFEIISLTHVPFEHMRIGMPNADTGASDKIMVHPDWARRFTAVRKFNKDDIHEIDIFNPNPDVIDRQVNEAGGWKEYRGQIYYYSGKGGIQYPEPFYASQLKNMRAEEALDTITLRNAAANFLPACVIADINNEDVSEEQVGETQQYIEDSLGDDNSMNMVVVSIKSKEEAPVKLELQGNNYDKAFTVSQEYVPDRIGKTFMQPKILLGEDVGSNFGADMMKNAYSFYNAITESERGVIVSIFKTVFAVSVFKNIEPSDMYITPVTYSVGTSVVDRLSESATKDIIDVIARDETELPLPRKRAVLKQLYGLEDIEVNELLTVK